MSRPLVKLTFKFFALGILTGSLLYFKSNSSYSSGLSQATPPQIVVAQQSEAPLLLTPTYVDTSNALSPHYGYLVLNVSGKSIRAFTIEEHVFLNSEYAITSTSLIHFPAVSLLLKPQESRQEEGGYGKIYKIPPTEVKLAIDFVEFTDGTRWGKDTSNSGQRLDGIRAGGRAAIKKYQEVLTNEGVSGLEKALTSQNLIRPDNPSQSSVWIDGFNMGANFVKSRLEAAKMHGGQDEIKRELSKPFDSTEGRQEP